jgi:hypothetical protein
VWPLHDLQGYVGPHADIQTTMIYVHDVPKVTAADELSRVVAEASGAEPLTVVPSGDGLPTRPGDAEDGHGDHDGDDRVREGETERH